MRPRLTEQIDGIGRILSEIVAPEVQSPYAKEILANAVAALAAISAALPGLSGFFRWDIEATRAVLNAALPALDSALAGEVRDAIGASFDSADLTALDETQERLRGLLACAIPAIVTDRGDAYRLMTKLFRERADRFPFSIMAAPVKPDPKDDEDAHTAR